MQGDVIAWWSGGITSAVTCKICIDLFGIDRVRIIFIDTFNEDEDTYRFLKDCEKWYGKEIESISAIGNAFWDISEIWQTHKSLNVATGAICSYILKRKVREDWQKHNSYQYQAFGFELSEVKRVKGLILNHPKAKAIFPLLMFGLSKKDCIKRVEEAGLVIPRVYSYGYLNNNCFKTGCVQGGIGYWQKMRDEYPDKFEAMAVMEHELTDAKGQPVTMLKDQGKEAIAAVKKTKLIWKQFVFLKPHKDYPELKSLKDMKPQKVEPLFECNGWCGINDLEKRKPSEKQINYQNE